MLTVVNNTFDSLALAVYIQVMKKPLALILCLLIIIGGVYFGYTYWQSNKPKPTTNTTTPTPQTPTDLTEGGKYLVIKEWGVRFPVPDDYRSDIQYAARPGEGDTFFFEVKSVDLDNCAPLAIVRTSEANLGNVKIDNHYFGFVQGAQACDRSDSQHQLKASQAQQKLYESLLKLEKVKE